MNCVGIVDSYFDSQMWNVFCFAGKQSVNRLKKQLQVDIPKLPKSVVQKTSKTAKCKFKFSFFTRSVQLYDLQRIIGFLSVFASNQNKNANKRNLKANRSKLCDDIGSFFS